jgi:glyoxylase-like metal-dependent hydrolase (beta-lactamase superfamily II)
MWIKEPGEIYEKLVLLGTPQNCVYLVKGDRHMLIGGGASWMAAEFDRQIVEFNIDMDRVRHLIISHSHYDHCTAVPYFQKRYPHIEVLASESAAKIFKKDKAVVNLRAFSRQVMEDLNLPDVLNGISLDFDGVHVTRTVREGDVIDLGGNLAFQVYETPGHSRCAITLFEPGRKWLFPSDSVAFPFPGRGENNFIATAFDGYEIYLNSLKKLANLGTRLCGWEHYGAMIDSDAEDIVNRVIRFTLEKKRSLRDMVAESGDLVNVAEAVARDWVDKTGFGFLRYEIMLPIITYVVRNAVEEVFDESRYLNLS